MKKLLALTLLSLPAFAQTVYLRTPGTGFCRITGATNATPIAITVADISRCGLANGDIVVITEVNGNYAANVHVKTAGSTTHLARKVSNLNSGTHTFDLLDLSDSPVAGSGTYTSGGRVGKATAYTAQSTFGILMGGPSGPIAASLLDTSSTGRKNAANRPYTALQNRTNTFNSTAWYWGKDRQGEIFSPTIAQALRWYMDSTATSRTQMIEGLKNPDQAYGTVSCTLSDIHCGLPNSAVADYARQYQAYSAQACAIGCSELSSTERSNLFDYWLRDLPWSQGGIDYTAAGWTRAPWKRGYVGDTYAVDYTVGTVSSSGNIITGSAGINFVTNGIVVGDVIFAPNPALNGGTTGCKIAALTETQITCTENFHSTVTNVTYAIGHGWDPGGSYLASEYQAKVYSYENRCGNCVNYGSSRTPSYNNNLTIVGLLGAMAKGLAACGYGDQRGCLLAEQTSEIFYDEMLRQYLVINGDGINASNASYNNWRVNSALLEMLAMLKTGIVSGPDYAPNFADDGINHFLHTWLPVYDQFMTVAEPYVFNPVTNLWREGFQGFLLLPTSNSRAKEFEWFLQQKLAYNSTADITYNGSAYVWWLLMHRDPAITEQTPRTTLLTQTGYAQCVSTFGATECNNQNAHGERGGIYARSGWGNSDTVMAYSTSAWSNLDHGDERAPGDLRIWKNGKGLLVNDGGTFYGTSNIATRSILSLVNDSNVPTISPYIPGTHRNATRPQGYGGENFTWQRGVFNEIYTSGVTKAERQVFYAKPGGFLVHDYVVLSSSSAIKARYHLALNGAGTATAPTYASVNRSAKTFTNNITGTAGLVGKAFALDGGTIAMVTANSSDTNLGYTETQGESGRFEICNSSDGSTCANGTSSEWVMVMETNSGSGSVPTIVSPVVVGSHRIVEVQSASPWVVAFTREGAQSTSLNFTTTFSGTGRYGITGLEAGTYTATVGGTPVSGSPFTVIDAERTITFDAAAGAVAIASTTAPPTITTTSLPDGAIGTSYSQTLAASGGTPAYAWDLSTGSLPPGLSLNASSGAITGTPTTAGTYNFTARVTDADTNTDTQALSITIPALPGPGYRLVLRQGVLLR